MIKAEQMNEVMQDATRDGWLLRIELSTHAVCRMTDHDCLNRHKKDPKQDLRSKVFTKGGYF